MPVSVSSNSNKYLPGMQAFVGQKSWAEALVELWQWKDNAPPGEEGARETAAKRIQETYERRGSVLILSGLDFTTLPKAISHFRRVDLFGCRKLEELSPFHTDILELNIFECSSLRSKHYREAAAAMIRSGQYGAAADYHTIALVLELEELSGLGQVGQGEIVAGQLAGNAYSDATIAEVNDAISGKLDVLSKSGFEFGEGEGTLHMDNGQCMVSRECFDNAKEWCVLLRSDGLHADLLTFEAVTGLIECGSSHPVTGAEIKRNDIVRGKDVLAYLGVKPANSDILE